MVKTYRPSRVTLSGAMVNPFVTGTLLWGVIRARSDIEIRTGLTGYKAFLTLLKVLLAWGTLKRINARLNSIALNHWKLRSDKAKWNWSNEVAIVTGGCSGFGLLVTERLVRQGVKVAVIDVSPFPDRLQGRK